MDADLNLKYVHLFLHGLVDADGSLQLSSFEIKLTYLKCDPDSFLLEPAKNSPISRFTWQDGNLLPSTQQH